MRSGFSIIKNGDSLGYPYIEALKSIVPFVDELVVAHGDSSDTTRATLEKLRPLISCELRIIESPWDPGNQTGGLELSRQTNIALDACRFDTCLYIQADEVLVDTNPARIKRDLDRFEKDIEVDALTFGWLHFFGNYQTVVKSKRWYRREIRAVKKSRGLRSFGDAQGFRILDGESWKKSRAALSAAQVYHYGWVRPPKVMAHKSESLDRLWHGNARDGSHKAEAMYPVQFGLEPFQDSHPLVMRERVSSAQPFDPFKNQTLKKDFRYLRMWATSLIESATGWRPGEFCNYTSLKKY